MPLFLHFLFGLMCVGGTHYFFDNAPLEPTSPFYENRYMKDHSLALSFATCETVSALHEFVVDRPADPYGFLRSQAGVIPSTFYFYRKDF